MKRYLCALGAWLLPCVDRGQVIPWGLSWCSSGAVSMIRHQLGDMVRYFAFPHRLLILKLPVAPWYGTSRGQYSIAYERGWKLAHVTAVAGTAPRQLGLFFMGGSEPLGRQHLIQSMGYPL